MSENINRENQQVLPFKPLIPSLNTYEGSLVETWAFKLLYDNPFNLQHFRITKMPLPIDHFLYDDRVIYAISAAEPGKPAHYTDFRKTVEKLRPTEARNNRRLFESADSFIAELNAYLTHAIQLIVYDVYFEILKRYYDPWGDIELHDKLQVTGNVNIHLMEAEALDNEPAFRMVMQNQWNHYRNMAVQSTQRFLQIKQSDEMVSMVDTMEYVNKMFEEKKEADRVKRANKADFVMNQTLRRLREQNPLMKQWEQDKEDEARLG